MKPSDLLTYWTSQTEIAAAIGIRQASVAEWFRSNVIPLERQVQLVIASGGHVKLDNNTAKSLRKRVALEQRALQLST
jgi:hypothetical protein